jgi:nitrate reductase gamma subunit
LIYLDLTDGRFFPSSILPIFLVDVGGVLLALFLVISLIYRARWWDIRTKTREFKEGVSALGLSSRISVVSRVITKDALAVEPLFHHYKGRWLNHALAFYGFIGLMLTTTLDAIVNRGGLPLPILSPVKLIGNVSGIMLMIGATAMLFSRRGKDYSNLQPLSWQDQIFLPTLLLTTATGFITEIFDYATLQDYASVLYVIHIILIVLLLGTAPWTRFVHALQAPYLAMSERFRQLIGAHDSPPDYKRLRLAQFAKDYFYPEYHHEESNKDESE